MRHIMLSIVLGLFGAVVSAQQAAVTECDRLAASPEDPDRVAPGVERAVMDMKAARAACEAEVARQPSQLRFRYQLARVLFYSGDPRGVAEMRATADAGYPQAQFVYGAMISNRRENAPTDLCITERYWLESARAGRQAARVSYVRHSLKGRFDGCPNRISLQEVAELLASARQQAREYYERLLIEDLTEQLEGSAAASRSRQ